MVQAAIWTSPTRRLPFRASSARWPAVVPAAADAARRQAEVIGEQLKRARAAYESGVEPITDLQQAQSELDSVRVDGIGADNRLANSRNALGQITGASHARLQKARPPYRVQTPDEAADVWVERALANNPGLIAQQQALAAAEQEVRQARGGHYPTVALTGSYGERESVVEFPGVGKTDSMTETTSVGIELSMPIFSGGRVSAAVDEAEYAAQQARQDMIRTRRQVELDARTAYRDLQAAAARVEALDRAITSGRTSVEAARAGLETGTRNILDVLQAEIDLIQRRVDQKQAWYDYAVAGLRLKQTAGTLDADDLRRVNLRLHQHHPEAAGKSPAR